MITDATPDRLLTVVEVAAGLRVHRMSVYRMIHSGQLPAIRLARNGALRVSETELRAWLYSVEEN